MSSGRTCRALCIWLLLIGFARADVGDPQVRTNHPWYPGELACSTFERLFETQADIYERVVGHRPQTDHDKALAAWLWRNTHYAHGEEGTEDLWSQGFMKGSDLRNREYWTGLFAHGFGLCGTTHSQWTAEMEALLGHGRGRGVGVDGHNSFEVFLTGGPYGSGRWALLDHDISTVVFNNDGTALLPLAEVRANWKQLTDRRHNPDRQHGWLVCGLHPDDGGVYRRYEVAEYLAGYTGPSPRVHLRRGESMRRYLQPGLGSGKQFVFWGRNYMTAGIPGLERSQTWVNQPDKMHGSKDGTGYEPGQARFGNVLFSYHPFFGDESYREAVVSEDDQQVTFEFQSPYIIGATPPNSERWGIYDKGCKNGLVVRGPVKCGVSVSIDRGQTWQDGGTLRDELDLTDIVKGRRQYFLRVHASAKKLAQSEEGITITTICQANPAVMPQLKDNGSEVRYETSATAVVSAGPNIAQAAAHVVDGKFGSPRVTLELKTPHGEPVVEVVAAAHVLSSNPPNPEFKYQIEFSTDSGRSWKPIVKDWTITRLGGEPADFWSQSLCWGKAAMPEADAKSVQVRFRNDGGKSYARAEAHLIYRTQNRDTTDVTFAWEDAAGPHKHIHVAKSATNSWTVPTGKQTRTKWVDFTLSPARSR